MSPFLSLQLYCVVLTPLAGIQGIPGPTGSSLLFSLQLYCVILIQLAGIQGIPGSTGSSVLFFTAAVLCYINSIGRDPRGSRAVGSSRAFGAGWGSRWASSFPPQLYCFILTHFLGIQGVSGASGQIGQVGPTGPTGPTGPAEPPGQTGATGIAFAYLGCFYQPAPGSLLGSGKVLSAFQITSTAAIDQLCSSTCNSQNYGQ